MAYPANYKYTREHEWISVAGSIGTIGITDYAQNSLGDIVYVDVPKVGDTVKAHSTFGSVESVKAVSDLYAPMSGEVTEVNTAVVDNVQLLADDPYELGWLIKLNVDDAAEFGELLDYEAYQQKLAEDAH